MPSIPSLLLVDVLGVGARWKSGGTDAAEAAFDVLAEIVETVLRDAPSTILGAELQTDTVCIASTSTNAALRVARDVYLEAFLRQRRERAWLRGVLVHRPQKLHLHDMRQPCRSLGGRIVVHRLAPPLLNAISLEKSGFKGMRMLVHPRLVTPLVKEAARITLGNDTTVDTLVRLPAPAYGHKRLAGFHDLLWMATDDQEEWRRRAARMARRLRQAAHSNEEVVHAAATQVVFDACEEALGYRSVPKRR